MKAWKYCIAYAVPLCAIVGFLFQGSWTFLTLVFVFALIPLLDLIFGVDDENPTPEQMEKLENQISFRLVLYIFVPVQLTLIFWGANLFSLGNISWIEKIGIVLSVGISTGGLGITIAHELAHKKRWLDRTLGKILLTSVSYMHFYIEHNLGHHTNVSTPNDPATARFGESFYKFYWRTVSGSFISAWKIEAGRLKYMGLPALHIKNQMIWFTALPVLFAAILGWLWGTPAVVFFFSQSIIAFSLLEAVNYLEHYGLEREKLASGKYEKVTAAHSWNANQRLTNYFLFKLQRHADHHIHPVREYQTLRSFDDSPQLPTGYAGMLVLVFFPPLWHKIMDKRVLTFRNATP